MSGRPRNPNGEEGNNSPSNSEPNSQPNGINKEGPGYKVDGNEDAEEPDAAESGWYTDAEANANADQDSATAEASTGAGWRTEEFDSFQVGVEARAGATADRDGELGADAEIKAEAGNNVFGVGVSATGGIGGDLSGLSNSGEISGGASVGADVAVRAGNAQKNGNEFSMSGGVGIGGGGGLIVGDDIDGDGQKEYGFEFGAKLGLGGAVSLRFEPDAVMDRVNEFINGSSGEKEFQQGKAASKTDVGSCVDRLESALEMPRLKEAYSRLESFLPI